MRPHEFFLGTLARGRRKPVFFLVLWVGAAMNRLPLLLLPLLFDCSIFTSQERKECRESAAYAGPALHPPLDSASLFPPASGLEGSLDPILMAKLDSALQWVMDTTHATGVSAAMGLPGKGIWSRQMGLASVAPDRKVDSNTVFHVASIGKLFTAAAVLKLIERDSLDYQDTLSRWFPEIRYSGLITVDQLLTHTNGIDNFNGDSAIPIVGYKSPQDLIALARGKASLFCPGERWYYSNTGYVLLASILERVTGKPFHAILRDEVMPASLLGRTRALEPETIPPEVAAPTVNGLPYLDFDQSMPFGAGNVVSTARDLVRFLEAYLQGRILGKGTIRDAAERLYPMFDAGTFYGRGLMVYEFAEAGGKRSRWVGHSGGTQGEKAIVVYDTGRKAFVSAVFNCDVSAEATVLRLLAVLDQAAPR